MLVLLLWWGWLVGSIVPSGALHFPVLERGDGAEGAGGVGVGGGCGEHALVVVGRRVFGAVVREPVVVQEGGFGRLDDG